MSNLAASMPKIWFITGCSTGFGRVLAQTLLDETDAHVVATARNVNDLAVFAGRARATVLPLDVTNAAAIDAALAQVQSQHGRIDVLVNNAGYGIAGALEETSDAALRKMFDVNVFGLFALTRAVLPWMRAQKSGHIINISSVVGVVGTPGFAAYCASKFAVEGLSVALALEVASFGIHVTAIEPGPFRTDFAGRSIDVQPAIDAYASGAGKIRQYLQNIEGKQPGDPVAAARAMIAVASMDKPPLHLPLGAGAFDRIQLEYSNRLQALAPLEALARGADYPLNAA